jgi:hypothetical protein
MQQLLQVQLSQLALFQQQLALIAQPGAVAPQIAAPAPALAAPAPAPAPAPATNGSASAAADDAKGQMKYDVQKAFGAIARIHKQSDEMTPKQQARLAQLTARHQARAGLPGLGSRRQRVHRRAERLRLQLLRLLAEVHHRRAARAHRRRLRHRPANAARR